MKWSWVKKRSTGQLAAVFIWTRVGLNKSPRRYVKGALLKRSCGKLKIEQDPAAL